MEELSRLQAEAMADDIEIDLERMSAWTEAQALSYFESGGTREPRAPGPIRMLCLHGGGGNRKVNAMQMGRLMSLLGGSHTVRVEHQRHLRIEHEAATFNFLEGHRVQDEVEPELKKLFGPGPYYKFYGITGDGNVEHMVPASDEWLRAMFDAQVEIRYLGVEEALDKVDAHVDAAAAAGKPYDVLSGFSQGGIVVTMLTARRLERAARGLGPPPSWRLNLLTASMPPRGTGGYAVAVPPPPAPPLADFPCVAMMGREDAFYEWGRHLFAVYGPRLRWFDHDGGHEAAREPEVNAAVARAIADELGVALPEPRVKPAAVHASILNTSGRSVADGGYSGAA
jgi:hypothetical protein